MDLKLPPGVTLHGARVPNDEAVLSADALAFVTELARTFRPHVAQLLAQRVQRARDMDALAAAGRPILDFLPSTREVREKAWTCAPIPADLRDRRVEITGPVDRKMVINALNSGARVYMADFEDSTTPTWANLIAGHQNLMDAVRRTITFEQADKKYALKEKTAVLMVRPRGLHLPESHLLVDDIVIPGALLDFGLYFFHNCKALMERGTAPYFYLPKLESHLEARLWNDVFVHAQRTLGVPNGTIRATVLIETLPAAFEMHEILHELRDHAAGLNCGRWDYIFSFIKKHRASATAILPDRAQITMDKGFLRAYSQLLIRTCHARGVHAMGGMAAQIPIKDDAAKNDAALARVRADKTREAGDGHDGTWVAHPGLVPVAMEVFDAAMPAPNQIDKLRLDVNVGPAELLGVPAGTRTEEGLRHDVRVGIQYVESWLRGVGCVPLYDLMEDAATAEISRALVWQWLHHEVAVGGAPLTTARYRAIADEETKQFTGGRFADARALFDSLSTAPEFADFLTIPAYARIVHDHS
jgi:malate synthase A